VIGNNGGGSKEMVRSSGGGSFQDVLRWWIWLGSEHPLICSRFPDGVTTYLRDHSCPRPRQLHVLLWP